MGFDLAFTLMTLAAALALFVSDRVRLDVVALGALLALLLAGVLTVPEALAGFADPLVLTIAGLFVVGEGLARTGVARRAGQLLGRLGGRSEARLVAGCMLTSAALSAFMSSTGAVALLIPVVLGVAREAGLSPSKLLLPLAYGSLLGGMLTLIGTPPNLVASAALEEAGLAPFGFFDFTPAGLAMVAGGVLFMLGAGRRLLPSHAAGEDEEEVERLAPDALVEEYDLGHTTHPFRVPAGTPAAGSTLRALALPERYGVAVAALLAPDGTPRDGELPGPETRVDKGAIVVLQGTAEAAVAAAAALGLLPVPAEVLARLGLARTAHVAEIILTPRSQLLGQTIVEARFRDRFGVQVVGIRRKGEPLDPPLQAHRLRFGDTLLVRGAPPRIKALRSQHRQFVVVGELALKGPTALERRAPLALGVVALMVVLLVAGVVPPVAAVLFAALLMVLTRCVELPGGYRAVSWESLLLIAGMLPMATALRKTGGLDHAVAGLVGGVGGFGPLVTLGVLFAATSALSLLMSNTATSVLLAPVAVRAGQELGVDPHAFLMAVALGASTAFSTPMASPPNTLVLGPGRYRFGDYLRVGLPLQALVLLLTLLVVPRLFPF